VPDAEPTCPAPTALPPACPACGYDISGLERCPECGYGGGNLLLGSMIREWTVEPEGIRRVGETLGRAERLWKVYVLVPVAIFIVMLVLGFVFTGLGLLSEWLSLSVGERVADFLGFAILIPFGLAVLVWYLMGVIGRLWVLLFRLPVVLNGPQSPVPQPRWRALIFVVGVMAHLSLAVAAVLMISDNTTYPLLLCGVFTFEVLLSQGVPITGRYREHAFGIPSEIRLSLLGVFACCVAIGYGVYQHIVGGTEFADGFALAAVIAIVGCVWLAARCTERVGTLKRLCEFAGAHEKTAAPEGTAA